MREALHSKLSGCIPEEGFCREENRSPDQLLAHPKANSNREIFFLLHPIVVVLGEGWVGKREKKTAVMLVENIRHLSRRCYEPTPSAAYVCLLIPQ